MSMYLILIANFILLDFAFLFPMRFFNYEMFLNFYILQVVYVLIQNILEREHRNYSRKNYVYPIAIGICFGSGILITILEGTIIQLFVILLSVLLVIFFILTQRNRLYFIYLIIFFFLTIYVVIFVSSDILEMLKVKLDIILQLFCISNLSYLLLFFSERKKQQSLLHKESIRIIKGNRKYTFFFYIFCLVSICVSNVFRGVAEYIFYGLMLYAIYPETKEIFQVNKKIHQILFLFCLLLSAVNVFWIRKGYVLNIFIFMTLFCFVAYVIWRRLEEELVFKKKEIVLLESIADSSRETRISFAQPIDISYTPRNVWQSCLGFLQKNKQIHIRNGEQEITFGYFISPREYEDMLEFIQEYAVLEEHS